MDYFCEVWFLYTMKTKFIIAAIISCIIVFPAFEDINGINRDMVAYHSVFNISGYIQDTPKLDSIKHQNKHTKKNRPNKDSIKGNKKDTVFNGSS